MKTFLVWKGVSISDPYRVCYRVADVIHKPTGYPLSFTMVALPPKYDNYEDAQKAADREETNLMYQENIFNSYFENRHGYLLPLGFS